MSVKLNIVNRTRGNVDARWIARHLRKVLGLLGIGNAEWSIVIVGDREMKALHLRTMGLDSTTDVLTFDLREEAEIKKTKEGCGVELDTVVCLDEAKRRGKQLGHPVERELLLYGVHSLLHVQGYDDVKKAEGARMHRREDELLIALSVGPVFRKDSRKSL
jgi:probable rRNA maturation factor